MNIKEQFEKGIINFDCASIAQPSDKLNLNKDLMFNFRKASRLSSKGRAGKNITSLSRDKDLREINFLADQRDSDAILNKKQLKRRSRPQSSYLKKGN